MSCLSSWLAIKPRASCTLGTSSVLQLSVEKDSVLLWPVSFIAVTLQLLVSALAPVVPSYLGPCEEYYTQETESGKGKRRIKVKIVLTSLARHPEVIEHCFSNV